MRRGGDEDQQKPMAAHRWIDYTNPEAFVGPSFVDDGSGGIDKADVAGRLENTVLRSHWHWERLKWHLRCLV
jgi:hypothetical protein